MTASVSLGRRTLSAGGLAAIALAMAPRELRASPERARAWLLGKVKGAPVEGKLAIRAPEIAENGLAVPITVSVDAPMTAGSHVQAIYVAADGNPDPGAASWRLSPLAGRAEVQMRMRLAATQKVWAVAETSDGQVFIASREVKVTIGGCGG